ncbi:MAG: RDD family protein [Cyclobacteriaceae bacterium]
MTEHHARYAGFSQRLLAHNIDLIPILLLLYGSSFVIPKLGYDWLIFLSIYLSYHIGFELSVWRATPGKKWAKIHVEPEKKEEQIIQPILRNLTKILSLILFFGGFILIIFSERKKALHDYLAGTVVLFDED